MKSKTNLLTIILIPLLSITPKVGGTTKPMVSVPVNLASHSASPRGGTITFAKGETRRFVAIYGVRDCMNDKYEVHPEKLILRLFPSSSGPGYMLVPVDKLANIKFTKISKRFEDGSGGSTGTAVEVTSTQGKKETFESWSFTIQVDLSDSVASAQFAHYQLWGAEISFDQAAK